MRADDPKHSGFPAASPTAAPKAGPAERGAPDGSAKGAFGRDAMATQAKPEQVAGSAVAAASSREGAEPTGNPLASSPARKAVDGLAGTAGAADAARAVPSTARVLRAASQSGGLGKLSYAGRFAAQFADEAVRLAGVLTAKAPAVAKVFNGLARTAPLLGAGVAALDVGRAAMENDPVKKQEATGLAVLSVTGGAAGLLAAGGAAGVAVGGLALAPLVVPMTVIGISATAVSLLDQFLLGGTLSRPIGAALGRATKALGLSS
ncbi:MAG: hypothetical protein VKP62_16910 [Candidatus Sericytochromatia bacterium]|nr:hypothetical protein [Candidatus Sericytochromatia bacterium]